MAVKTNLSCPVCGKTFCGHDERIQAEIKARRIAHNERTKIKPLSARVERKLSLKRKCQRCEDIYKCLRDHLRRGGKSSGQAFKLGCHWHWKVLSSKELKRELRTRELLSAGDESKEDENQKLVEWIEKL